MAKPRKKAAAPEPPPMPQVGDKVKPARSEMVYEISHVHHGGDEVDLHVSGTNLQRFSVRTDTITFVERRLKSLSSGRRHSATELARWTQRLAGVPDQAQAKPSCHHRMSQVFSR